MPLALITGASAGLGRALALGLARTGWDLIIDDRRDAPLARTAAALRAHTGVHAIAGDVADPRHRAALAAAAGGRLDLLVNNASTLGPTPLPPLLTLDPAALADIHAVNTAAPLALIQLTHPALVAADGVVLNISSDAAVEHYPGWGGYAAAKTALDHITGTLAAEDPTLHYYAVDPGDMRTAMHQAAFPGEDISDRPDPATVVPALLRLIETRPPSGRYRAAAFAPVEVSA